MNSRLGRVMFVSLCLVSCAAKSTPTRITVKVADTYAGPLRLTPCSKEAQELVLIDETGGGQTAACPLGEVEIVVVQRGATIVIPQEQITIARAGDGFPVSITAVVPAAK
jgi:hypothetical protein